MMLFRIRKSKTILNETDFSIQPTLRLYQYQPLKAITFKSVSIHVELSSHSLFCLLCKFQLPLESLFVFAFKRRERGCVRNYKGIFSSRGRKGNKWKDSRLKFPDSSPKEFPGLPLERHFPSRPRFLQL